MKHRYALSRKFAFLDYAITLRLNRLDKHLAKLQEAITSQNTQKELMFLMNDILEAVPELFQQGIADLQKAPLSWAQRLFAHLNAPNSKALPILLFSGIPEIQAFFQPPERKEGLQSVIYSSTLGAAIACVFGGLVGVGFDLLAKGYHAIAQKLSPKPDRTPLQRKQLIEEVIGNKMILELVRLSKIKQGQSTIEEILSSAAKRVSVLGFISQFVTALALSQPMLSAASIIATPVAPAAHHIQSTLQVHTPELKTLANGASQYAKQSDLLNQLPRALQWLIEQLPPQVQQALPDLPVAKLFTDFQTVLNEGKTVLWSFLEKIPFAGPLLEKVAHGLAIALNKIPLKAELASGGISLAINLTLGLGTMVLLEQAQQNNGTLPEATKTDLQKQDPMALLRFYIHSIRNAFKTQLPQTQEVYST